MKEAFSIRKLFIRNYLILVIAMSLLHFGLLFGHYGLGFGIAFTDAFISNSLLYLFLLGLWFVVRFAPSDKLTAFSSVLNASVAGIILLAFWLLTSTYLLEWFLGFSDSYLSFLEQSLVIRFFGGVFVAIIVYLSFYLGIYQQSVTDALQRENELKILVQKTELQALKNQLNPHFIYNSLNSIGSLTITHPAKAREMVVMLSDFLRYALKKDAMQLTTLENELEHIRLYLQIEKIRFEEKLLYEFGIVPEHLNQKLPVLILQPLFENAVKHGVQQSSEPITIGMKTTVSDRFFEIQIWNHFDADFNPPKGEGIGIENIRNRLSLIYHNPQLLSLVRKDNLFTAILRLPLSS